MPQVLDISCTLKSTDPCGEVLAGYLVIRGLVVEAELDYDPNDFAERDFRSPAFVVHKDYKSSDRRELSFAPDQDFMPDGREEVPVGTKIFCLLLDIRRLGSTGRSDYATMLVLRESLRQHGCYERIGFWSGQFYDHLMLENGKMRTIRII